MFSEKHYPSEVKGPDLDAYLAKGWYRMGQSIFTTHFLCFGSEFYSALWIRADLSTYALRKSLRKLHNKNKKVFTIRYGLASITPEKEALYRIYKSNFPAPLSPSLKESLLDLEDRNIFDTYEVCVYDEDRLVACSFFDVGEESVASILGIYDAAYSKYSLGLYTMVLELIYAKEQGFKYYYPGYVVPGYSRFDYKLRIGEVSYYHLKTNTWRPFTEESKTETPLREMHTRLQQVDDLLKARQIKGQIKYYPMFEANLVSFSLTTYFDYPILLKLLLSNRPDEQEHDFFLVVYNNKSGLFQLLHCMPFDSPFFYFKSEFIQSFNENKNHFLLRLITINDLIFETKDAQLLVDQIESRLRLKN